MDKEAPQTQVGVECYNAKYLTPKDIYTNTNITSSNASEHNTGGAQSSSNTSQTSSQTPSATLNTWLYENRRASLTMSESLKEVIGKRQVVVIAKAICRFGDAVGHVLTWYNTPLCVG